MLQRMNPFPNNPAEESVVEMAEVYSYSSRDDAFGKNKRNGPEVKVTLHGSLTSILNTISP